MTTEDESEVAEPEEGGATEGSEEGRKRSAETRIQALIAKNKELADTLDKERQDNKRVAMPPAGQPESPSPEALKAIEGLKKLGFVHKDEFNQQVRSIEDRIILETEHARLKEAYNGQDGRPKYDAVEIEQYMRERGIADPESAYKLKNEPELNDWLLKQASQKKTRPYTTPASAPRPEEGRITRQKIAEMQNSPNWREWYETNRAEILGMMHRGELS